MTCRSLRGCRTRSRRRDSLEGLCGIWRASSLALLWVAACWHWTDACLAETDRETSRDRSAWFTDARLGMFIHWSAGAVEGARWHGEPLRNPVPYGEWLRCRNRVPRADYDKLISRMTITKEQVDEWAKLAADAGMKYLIFVAKHHDGLAYWPSDVSDYTYQELTGEDTDVVSLVADACKRNGLELGFYYSQWQDWEHPYGWGNFWDYEEDVSLFGNIDWHDDLYSGRLFRTTLTDEQYREYWQAKSVPQIEELITRYDPALFWFDMYTDLETTNMDRKDVEALLRRIRKLSPKCLVNTRIGISDVGPNAVDYQTMGDNKIPTRTIDHPWESSVTLNRSWGYNRDDLDWKPTAFFVRSLVNNISNGGNLQINIGPRANGEIPRESVVTLQELGRCLRQNHGKGFYECGPSPFSNNSQDWGLVTASLHDERRLFLHVFEWPLDGVIRLNGLQTQIQSARIAATGDSINAKQMGLLALLDASSAVPIDYDTVIELVLAAPPVIEDSFIGQKNMGGYYLDAERAESVSLNLQDKSQGGWVPPHLDGWSSNGSLARWRIYVPEQSERKITICYACSKNSAGGTFELLLDGVVVAECSTEPTHVNWNEYRTFKVGSIDFPTSGIFEIAVRSRDNASRELMHLAWLHIE